MTEETKKLFQAPWTVDGGLIRDCYDRMLFSTRVGRNMDTKRMSHMPELYDALVEAKNEMFIMLNEWALGKSEVEYLASYRERKGKNNYEFFNEIQEFLRKVRDGE